MGKTAVTAQGKLSEFRFASSNVAVFCFMAAPIYEPIFP
jgi:hypothetical protein